MSESCRSAWRLCHRGHEPPATSVNCSRDASFGTSVECKAPAHRPARCYCRLDCPHPDRRRLGIIARTPTKRASSPSSSQEEGERERAPMSGEEQRERERESWGDSVLSTKPDAGLDLTPPKSSPELKPRVWNQELKPRDCATQARCHFFF